MSWSCFLRSCPNNWSVSYRKEKSQKGIFMSGWVSQKAQMQNAPQGLAWPLKIKHYCQKASEEKEEKWKRNLTQNNCKGGKDQQELQQGSPAPISKRTVQQQAIWLELQWPSVVWWWYRTEIQGRCHSWSPPQSDSLPQSKEMNLARKKIVKARS